MIGYKVGQKVSLLDGSFLDIKNVQEGMLLQTIVLPNNTVENDGLEWSSKEITELTYVSSEVNKVSRQSNTFININELSLNNKEILVYNSLESKFEFKNVKDLYIGDDYKLVRIDGDSILLENIYHYEKSDNEED